MHRIVDDLRGLALAIFRQSASLRLTQVAASLAFLSLLALVPVFSLAFSVMAALPMFGRLRDALQKFLAANLFLPSFADTVVRLVNQFASKASELSLFGAILFFATAFSALLTLDRALNQIWGTERSRSLARRITLYWTLLTLGPLVLAASLAVNGLIVSDWLAGLPTRTVQRAWLQMVPWLLGLAGLTLMYRLLPTAPVRWRDAVIGALVAGVGIELLRAWLGTYVARLPTYTVVYGAFSALPLFLLWLFALWSVVLFGALCAANLRYWGQGLRVHLPWSPANRYATALRALAGLSLAQKDARSPVPVRELAGIGLHDATRVEAIARLLSELGYIHRHWQVPSEGQATDLERAIWDEAWSLTAPASTLSPRRLFEAVWNEREGMGREGLRRRRGMAAVPPDLRSGRWIDAPSLDLGLDRIGDALGRDLSR